MGWLQDIRSRISWKSRAGYGGIAPLLAFYWSGGPVRGHPVKRIDADGAFIETSELWCLGTQLQIRIQERNAAGQEVSYLVHTRTARLPRFGNEDTSCRTTLYTWVEFGGEGDVTVAPPIILYCAPDRAAFATVIHA